MITTDSSVTVYRYAYGKRVLVDRGPVVPDYEHKVTSLSKGFPVSLLDHCHPSSLGEVISTQMLLHPDSYNRGAVFIRCLHQQGYNPYVLVGCIRPRSEKGENIPGRTYTQCVVFVFKEVDWQKHAPNLLQHAASWLVAVPDIHGEDETQDTEPLNFTEYCDSNYFNTDDSIPPSDSIVWDFLLCLEDRYIIFPPNKTIVDADSFLRVLANTLALTPPHLRSLFSACYGFKKDNSIFLIQCIPGIGNENVSVSDKPPLLFNLIKQFDIRLVKQWSQINRRYIEPFLRNKLHKQLTSNRKILSPSEKRRRSRQALNTLYCRVNLNRLQKYIIGISIRVPDYSVLAACEKQWTIVLAVWIYALQKDQDTTGKLVRALGLITNLRNTVFNEKWEYNYNIKRSLKMHSLSNTCQDISSIITSSTTTLGALLPLANNKVDMGEKYNISTINYLWDLINLSKQGPDPTQCMALKIQLEGLRLRTEMFFQRSVELIIIDPRVIIYLANFHPKITKKILIEHSKTKFYILIIAIATTILQNNNTQAIDNINELHSSAVQILKEVYTYSFDRNKVLDVYHLEGEQARNTLGRFAKLFFQSLTMVMRNGVSADEFGFQFWFAALNRSLKDTIIHNKTLDFTLDFIFSKHNNKLGDQIEENTLDILNDLLREIFRYASANETDQVNRLKILVEKIATVPAYDTNIPAATAYQEELFTNLHAISNDSFNKDILKSMRIGLMGLPIENNHDTHVLALDIIEVSFKKLTELGAIGQSSALIFLEIVESLYSRVITLNNADKPLWRNTLLFLLEKLIISWADAKEPWLPPLKYDPSNPSLRRDIGHLIGFPKCLYMGNILNVKYLDRNNIKKSKECDIKALINHTDIVEQNKQILVTRCAINAWYNDWKDQTYIDYSKRKYLLGGYCNNYSETILNTAWKLVCSDNKIFLRHIDPDILWVMRFFDTLLSEDSPQARGRLLEPLPENIRIQIFTNDKHKKQYGSFALFLAQSAVFIPISFGRDFCNKFSKADKNWFRSRVLMAPKGWKQITDSSDKFLAMRLERFILLLSLIDKSYNLRHDVSLERRLILSPKSLTAFSINNEHAHNRISDFFSKHVSYYKTYQSVLHKAGLNLSDLQGWPG